MTDTPAPEQITPTRALDLAIFALNTLAHPDASSAEDLATLDKHTDAALAALAAIRDTITGKPGTWTTTVTIEAATEDQAQRVLAERLGFDDDYGFAYSIDHGEITGTPTGYIARFSPEAWINDNAVPADPQGPTEWDATQMVTSTELEPYFAALLRVGADPIDTSDALKADAHAPQWVRDWTGPFTIRVRKAEPDETMPPSYRRSPQAGDLAWHVNGLDPRPVARVSQDGTEVWLHLLTDSESGPYPAENYIFTAPSVAA